MLKKTIELSKPEGKALPQARTIQRRRKLTDQFV